MLIIYKSTNKEETKTTPDHYNLHQLDSVRPRNHSYSLCFGSFSGGPKSSWGIKLYKPRGLFFRD